MQKTLLLGTVFTVLIGFGIPGTQAFALTADCGGIINASLTQDKVWAHLDRNSSSNTQAIRVTASNATDEDAVDCECDGANHAVLADTEWTSDSGTPNPSKGTYTDWKPSVRGDSIKVYGKFKDASTPNDDPDVTKDIVVKAYEVKIVMQVVDNAEGGNGTQPQTSWEYESETRTVTLDNLPCSKTLRCWDGDPTNHEQSDEDAAHIDYTFEAVPSSADLYGGKIRGKLKTYSSADLVTNVEDVDSVDGSVTVSLGVTAGTPVGFGATVDVVFDGDCCEGTAAAAFGYSQTGGLGATQSPANNKVERASAAESDPMDISYLCWSMRTNALDSDEENHEETVNKSYDTGWVTLDEGNSSTAAVQAEWTGYVHVQTGGAADGKTASATLSNWDVTAQIKDVDFVP